MINGDTDENINRHYDENYRETPITIYVHLAIFFSSNPIHPTVPRQNKMMHNKTMKYNHARKSPH